MSKVTFNGVNKLILVNNSITELDVKTDIYSEWKSWSLIGDNLKYLPAISCIGGDPIGGANYLGSTFFLENAWKIKPYSWNHTLTITGNLFTRDQSSPFVSCDGSFNVLISMSRSNLVDTISTGGSSTSSGDIDYDRITNSVWNAQTNSSFDSGSIGEFVTKKLLTLSKFLGLK
jgi:hypothetical protein